MRKGGKAGRQEARAATRTQFVDGIEDVFANVKQFKRLERLIERADLPLRAGRAARDRRRLRSRDRHLLAVGRRVTVVTLVVMGVGFADPDPVRAPGRLAAACAGSRTSCPTC